MTISASTPQRVVVLLTSIALALVLLLAGAVVARASDTGATPPVVAEEILHTVTSGETLWEIGTLYTDPGEDLRDTIHDIRDRNGLDDSLIRVGDVLRVPVEF